MRAPNRFEIVAPLPSPRHHLHVAVDRGSNPPRAVVLALYPRTLSDDPGRLGRLCGEVERAAQLFHANILPPVGIEAVGDDLAAVTVWRDAMTLREILDAGGRLPADIASRIAVDLCAGLAHAHGRSEPVVHGLLRPEAVLVDETGTAALSGFGMPGGSGISDDLLGLGELLQECLMGEPPEGPLAPTDAAALPAPLVAVLNKARAAQPEARFPTADALGEAIAQAVAPAPRETVAAYVEAILPLGGGQRAERRKRINAALAGAPAAPQDAPEGGGDRASVQAVLDAIPSAAQDAAEEISEDDIVEVATAAPQEHSTVDPAPAAPIAPVPPASSVPAAAAGVPAAGALPSASGASIDPVPAAATALSPEPRSAPVHQERSERRGLRVSLAAALAMSLGGAAVGFAVARLAPWIPLPQVIQSLVADVRPHAEAQPSDVVRARADAQPPQDVRPRAGEQPPEDHRPLAEEQPPDSAAAAGSPSLAEPFPAPSRPPPEKKRPSVRHPDARASASPSGGTGLIVVTAPEDAEVWLDGRRIAKGNTRKQVSAGNHRIEVRQGRANVGEPFQLGPGETYTYAVTPQR